MRLKRLTIVYLLFAAIMTTVASAQFTFTNDNGAITITGYAGNPTCLKIPNTMDGHPVTSIGDWAFSGFTELTDVIISNGISNIEEGAFNDCENLSSVTIPTSVTNIEAYGFAGCNNLKSLTIPNSINNITDHAFYGCGLTNLTIPDSVTDIGNSAFAWSDLTSLTIPNNVVSIEFYAFGNCHSLTNVTIGNGLTYLADDVFWECDGLTSVYFEGNAPDGDTTPFYETFYGVNAIVYYLPGTIGWDTTFGNDPNLPTALWTLPYPLILNDNPSFGMQSNHFGFTVSWATNLSIVVETCTNFSNPIWQSIQTNPLTGGTFYFSDPQWTNYPGRFYRIRSP